MSLVKQEIFHPPGGKADYQFGKTWGCGKFGAYTSLFVHVVLRWAKLDFEAPAERKQTEGGFEPVKKK